MTKYFGEFLIEKSKISHQTLVEALLDQMATTLSFSQAAYKEGFLSAEEMLQAFRYQQRHEADFIAAIQALGLGGDDLKETLTKKIEETKAPLGEILIKKGALDLKTLIQMLDEFLSQEDREQGELEQEVETPKEESVLAGMVSDNLTELEKAFNEKTRQSLKVAMRLARDERERDFESSQKILRDFLKMLLTLRGLTAFLELKLMTDLFGISEKFLEHFFREDAPSRQESFETMLSVMENALEQIWLLKDWVTKNGSEEGYLKNEDQNKNYEDLMMVLLDSINS
jgi:hypothetical protein